MLRFCVHINRLYILRRHCTTNNCLTEIHFQVQKCVIIYDEALGSETSHTALTDLNTQVTEGKTQCFH